MNEFNQLMILMASLCNAPDYCEPVIVGHHALDVNHYTSRSYPLMQEVMEVQHAYDTWTIRIYHKKIK